MPQGGHVSNAHESNQAPSNPNPGMNPSPHEYDEDELDGDEDRQSDEGSEGEPDFNDMEFWVQRCSICFDSRLDFCLEYCRDQFCRSCFQRYVKEVVSNSWGLDVTKIKCPVCQDTIAVSEWTKYVDQSTLAQYHQYNQPYRSFSRFCGDCDQELVVSEVNRAAIGLSASGLLPLFDKILIDLKTLLTRAGLSVDGPDVGQSPTSPSSSTTRKPPSTNPKHRRVPSSRDELARKIVQRFTDNYQSYCDVLQGTQQSLPSRAQTYLTSLANRALGASFSLEPPPSSTTHVSSKSSQPLQQTDLSPSSSTGYPSSQASQATTNSANTLGSTHQSTSAPFQSRQHCSRASGVLEIYRPLVTSLLDLFDLKQEEHDGEPATRLRIDVFTREAENGTSQLSLANQEHSPVSGNDPVFANEIMDEDTEDSTIKGSPCATKSRQSNKSISCAQSRIVTRAFSKQRIEIKRSLVHLSKQLSSIETRPEQWKELQFLHVRWLRWEWCNNYNGAGGLQKRRSTTVSARPPSKAPFHPKPSFKGKGHSDLDMSTIQWKLANTSPCPNCCILIHRDDGCNKVDCMLCGYRFCWVCREAWGVACGFFKCGRRPTVNIGPKPSAIGDAEFMDDDAMTGEGQVHSLPVSHGFSGDADQDPISTGISRQDRRRRGSEDLSAIATDKPEIGVPNVFVIHTKRSRA
ncbi:E3 ubiquitin-protein ligase arih2 [Modicella reniformis]|uniref:E3 ubiquitin-protein ligase arih2 n=1 Tax=Modicella reniformis TaxID=1440133 RepID=A0A9P6MLN2_9FUNG|nr:E3 ubiquitin-protein ligase arih2 [Modicella reniformis]